MPKGLKPMRSSKSFTHWFARFMLNSVAAVLHGEKGVHVVSL